MTIFVVDDDEIMRRCIVRACEDTENFDAHNGLICEFSDAYAVMDRIREGVVPDVMFLDVMLNGPDGFTLLNEMVSYTDTAAVPVVLVTSLAMTGVDLAAYGVVGVLEKEWMRPEEIKGYVNEYAA